MRGAGGGHVGIVSRFVFDPVPEPDVTVFRLVWRPDSAADLVAAWMEWAPVADDRLTAQLELSAPADPQQPPAVRLIGTMVAGSATTRTAVAELGTRARREAREATFSELRYAHAKSILGDDSPEGERPVESHRSQFLGGPFSAATGTELLHHLIQERRPGQTRTLSFLPMGGAYNRVPPEATAFAHRTHRFLVEHIAAVRATATGAEQQAAADWSDRSRRILAAEASGGVYPNFADADLLDWADAYWGTNQARLRQVKQRYDPNNLFWARQGLAAVCAQMHP